MTAENEEAWSLSDDDRTLLRGLESMVRELIPLAASGQDLIALGEAWDSIERILDGQCVEVNVGVDLVFREGDAELNRRLYVCLRINCDAITLYELWATYSRKFGSDQSIKKTYAVLAGDGGFSADGVQRWLRRLEEVRGWKARLSTERDHV